jgi:hypothetical protein
MPRYRVRLEDPNSEHFRLSYVTADDRDGAAAKVVEIDQSLVDDPEYPQDEPYVVADVTARGQLRSETKATAREAGE